MKNTSFNDIINGMWDDFDKRVWQICDFYEIKKQQLAEKIGMPQQRLSRLKEGKHHQEAYLILLAFPEVNARWLLFGEGQMFESEAEKGRREPVPEWSKGVPTPLDTDTREQLVVKCVYLNHENIFMRQQLLGRDFHGFDIGYYPPLAITTESSNETSETSNKI